MDKAEYRVKLDQITAFAEKEDYVGALPIIEEIDWRRVKSVRTLCMVSEIYEANGCLEDSYRILKIAYKRASISKTVLYRLAETSAKLGDYDEAIEYYREFEEISPMDSSKYILKYEIYKEKGASIESQIKVLEEYKEREYTEQWAYELAKLYSKAGMTDACVETCDDLILWFSEGSYVKGAMELKKKYAPLTVSQVKKYQELDFYKTPEEEEQEQKQAAKASVRERVQTSEKTAEISFSDQMRTGRSGENMISGEQVVQRDPTHMQNQLADSIRAVFSGINRGSESFSEEDAESEEKEYNPMNADMSEYDIKELEPESVRDEIGSLPTNTKTVEKDEMDDGQIVGQMSFNDFKKDQEFDLEALLAETSSSLAQEVASGEFHMTDEVISVSEDEGSEINETEDDEIEKVLETEEKTVKTEEDEESEPEEEETAKEVNQEPGTETEELEPEFEAETVEETDESLGLTREFHFHQELKQTEAEQSIDDEVTDFEEEKRFSYIPVEPRDLTEKEKEIFSYFTKIPGMSQQITETLCDVHNNAGDKTSKGGNFLVIGRQGAGKTRLYECMVLAICNDLEIEAAKMAKVIGRDLNKKDPIAVVSKLSGGFLVIEGAGELNDETVQKLTQAMEFRTDGLVVVLEDEKADLFALLDRHPKLSEKFTSSIKIPVFTNDELVTFAKTYARENGYKMDEMGILALYTKISENQKNQEPVTVGKVKDIMDEAFDRANRGTRKLGRKFSKNTAEDDRVLLREKDFD